MAEPLATCQSTCLVTRPRHQSDRLVELLDQAGWQSLLFPSIEIIASSAAESLPERIHDYDIALFVSRNAVDYSFLQFPPGNLPDKLQLGVIGKGSLQALQRHGVESALLPADQYNSEGLLAAEALQQVADKRILILRGQPGRNLLGDTLRLRGAHVDYLEVYRRTLPEYPDQYLEQLTQQRFPQLAIFTSAEGLRNTLQLVSENMAQQLRRIPWLLISERMRETARNLGHNASIIIAVSASDEGIVEAIEQWQQSNKKHHP